MRMSQSNWRLMVAKAVQLIHIELSSANSMKFTVSIPPWNDLVAMAKANLKLADGDDLLLGPGAVFVKISSHDVHIIGQSFQVIKAVF